MRPNDCVHMPGPPANLRATEKPSRQPRSGTVFCSTVLAKRRDSLTFSFVLFISIAGFAKHARIVGVFKPLDERLNGLSLMISTSLPGLKQGAKLRGHLWRIFAKVEVM